MKAKERLGCLASFLQVQSDLFARHISNRHQIGIEKAEEEVNTIQYHVDEIVVETFGDDE